jgi:hypothetical protein
MRIRHLSGPKKGQSEHCENTAGRALILAGLAELHPYKNYIERLSEETKLRTGCTPGDAVVSMDTTWGVRDTTGSPFSHVVIIKKSRGETFFYEFVPEGCPKSIADKFQRLVAAASRAGADRAAIDKAKEEQQMREFNDRTEKYKVLSPRFF